MSLSIVLVRHGRSGHVHSGWIDGAGFVRWRDAYENAGIDAREVAPEALRAIAASSAVIAASDTRRATESAALLAPDREIVTSPLLRELDLPAPHLGRMRLPLFAWALAIGLQWIGRVALRRPPVTPAEEERGRDGAEWLSALAETHGSVLAVTHASFRSLAAQELVRRGWHLDPSGRTSRHWSAWTFKRP